MYVKNNKIPWNNILLYVVNTLLSLIYLSPLIWMVVSSVKPENRIFSDMSKGIQAFVPLNFTLANYEEVFTRSNMLRYLGNSVAYITILVICSLIINSMCGYALAKFEFKGKKILFSLILALLILPLESIILSLFFIVNKLG